VESLGALKVAANRAFAQGSYFVKDILRYPDGKVVLVTSLGEIFIAEPLV
jgi:hypothetical protein